MSELEKKIIDFLKEKKTPCYISKLVTKYGEVVILISERPLLEVLNNWDGTIEHSEGIE